MRPAAQEHQDSLQTVLDTVVAHQGARVATRLVGRLLAALVEPSPEAYRPLLRRIAALEGAPVPSPIAGTPCAVL